MAPNYTMRDIIDGSNKNMFGPKPDLSSTGAPYTAANPPQVTGFVGWNIGSFPTSNDIGIWNLPDNPIKSTGFGAVPYYELTNPTDIAGYGGIVFKKSNGTIITTGDTSVTGQYVYALHCVEQRNDLKSARIMTTHLIWSGSYPYSNGDLYYPTYTWVIVPWNTPGNLGLLSNYAPIITHRGYYEASPGDSSYTPYIPSSGGTQSPMTINGYTWPTPLNGPVSTTLWTP
jgi:hypothetical protein